MSVRGSVWLCRVTYAHVYSELLYTSVYGCEKQRTALTPVVPNVNSVIHRITLYPMDNAIGFHNTYPLDSEFSGLSCSKGGIALFDG